MNLFKKLFGQKNEAFDEEKALAQEANNSNRLSCQRVYRVLANAHKYGVEGVRSNTQEEGLFAEEEYEYAADGISLYIRYEPSRYAENKSSLHVRITVQQQDEELVVCDDAVEESMLLTSNDFLQWKQEGEWREQVAEMLRQLSTDTYEAYKAQSSQN